MTKKIVLKIAVMRFPDDDDPAKDLIKADFTREKSLNKARENFYSGDNRDQVIHFCRIILENGGDYNNDHATTFKALRALNEIGGEPAIDNLLLQMFTEGFKQGVRYSQNQK